MTSEQEYVDDEARRMNRKRRREQMRKRKMRQLWIRRAVILGIPVLLIVILIFFIHGKLNSSKKVDEEQTQILQSDSENQGEDIAQDGQQADDVQAHSDAGNDGINAEVENQNPYLDAEYGPFAEIYSEEKNIFFDGYKVQYTHAPAYPSEEEVLSNYALLIDADTGEVIAAKDEKARISPASMTKILTILVAAEHVTDLDDTFRLDYSITNFAYVHDCSAVGFSEDEVATVRDLMYGTILPSGGDAAMALAEYVGGSVDRFVDMMNDKVAELGLSGTTHFTNCVGIYDENHYTTLTDMAMIMKAAVENELAKKILMEHTYVTSSTPEHPEGISISNWFLRRIEDKDTHGEVLCAKTGFVKQSGCCAASYEVGTNGKHYICVTADAWSSWRCIYDHVAMYDAYVN